jgi:hypothetical protein
MLVDADLIADDISEQSRADLVEKATAVGLRALTLQIRNKKLPAE